MSKVRLKVRGTSTFVSVDAKQFLTALNSGINKADDSINIGGTQYIASSVQIDPAAGNATLVGGTIAVPHPAITATSIVMLGKKSLGGGGVGNLSYTLNPGVGFTINSSAGTDVTEVSYMIVE
jgi:hypothetical protein